MSALLADYALKPEQVSRKFPQPDTEGQSPFQCDRNRILRCAAFRRLDYKTQVFAPHEHDLFRTRLTHTLEVAQVGRDIGRALGLSEDLIEAVALAHDLGHPPFGHLGEAELDKLMTNHGQFEHNRQSLRVVDYLEHPFPQFRGLNLTNATRHCIATHQTRYDTPTCDDFPDATTTLPPMEGQVVELADEIAYTTADLEDALMSQWISQDDLETLSLWQRSWQRAEQLFPKARAIHKRIQATQGLLNILQNDLLKTTRQKISELKIDSPQAVIEAGIRCTCFSDEIGGELQQLQDFMLQRVYRHENNLQSGEVSRKILRGLFEALIEDNSLLPPRYHERIDGQVGSDSPHRVVCDYIAGMTDRFCRDEHERIVS